MAQLKDYSYKTLAFITWPLFIELFFYMFMSSADTFMLSMYSDSSVAAVGMANQALFFVSVMFNCVAMGTSVLMTQNYGANRPKAAKKIASMSIYLNLLFGILISLLVFFSGGFLLKFMNTPAEIFPTSHQYLQIVGSMLFLAALGPVSSAILRSSGDTKTPMKIVLFGNALNILGNAIFIFGLFGIPTLGPIGVAFSTVFARFVQVIIAYSIIFLRLKISWRFKFDALALKNILAIGVPGALEQFSYSGSQIFITAFVATLGIASITTRTYVNNITMFVYLFAASLSQANELMVGHMIGAQLKDLAYKRVLQVNLMAQSVSALLGTLVVMTAPLLLPLFTYDPEVIVLGQQVMIVIAILEPGRAMNLAFVSALRASGNAKIPMIVGILGMWLIAVPIAYFAGIYLGLGLVGIYLGMMADEWVRGFTFLIIWQRKNWMHRSNINLDLEHDLQMQHDQEIDVIHSFEV
ncbi:MAG: MATE family efflux transporter [Culicoidibacterales bacterium]